MTNRRTLGGLLLAAALMGGSVLAAPKDLGLADRHFLNDAAEGGLAEVRLGQVAVEKSANADVKEFGRRMVTDHGRMNLELSGLAKERGVMPPKDIGPKHRKTLSTLAILNGADFDRAYMEAMVKDHTEDVDAFQKQAHDGTDPTLKAWVEKSLPMLRDHLKLARDVAIKVGAKVLP